MTAPYRVVPMPRPVEGSAQVELDDAWPAALARRLERLVSDPAGVLVHASGSHAGPEHAGPEHAGLESPGLAAALRAAWDLLPLERPGHLTLLGTRVNLDTGHAERTGPTCSPAATELLLGRSGIELLATGWLLACSDDLVVLHRRGEGLLTAELLAVAFPSGWPPRRRGGATLRELHGPVADGERLQRAAPALSEALLMKGPLRQHVWGLDPDGRLDRDPSAPDGPGAMTSEPPSGDPADWWLRVERQTSVPLPHLDRALFTIRPYLVPLTALSPAQCLVLAQAVGSMSPASLAYKGIADLAADLVCWLQLRVGSAG